jgi:hypothetical protein
MTVNVAQKLRGSSRLGLRICGGYRLPLQWPGMGDTNEKPRRYRWPWFVLAAFLLAIALAIVWLSFAVHREKQERDVNAPLPGAPAR